MRKDLLLVCVLILSTISHVGYTQTYSPELLFSLQYGNQGTQIGVRWSDTRENWSAKGPTSIAVDDAGKVYIADQVNQYIKCFNPSGVLVMLTSTPLENIGQVAVDSGSGAIYALWGSARNKLTKFSKDGDVIWTTDRKSIVPKDLRKEFYGSLSKISVGPNDSVCVRLVGKSSALAVLDKDGTTVELKNGYAATRTGKIFVLAARSDDSFGLNANVRDFQGRSLRSFQVSRVQSAYTMLRGSETGRSGQMFDSSENIYTVVSSPNAHNVQLSQNFSIGSDLVVTKYNPSGTALAQVRFPGSPFMGSLDNVAVDSSGNIYHLSYENDKVNVIKYVAGSYSGNFETLLEMPTLTTEGSQYVPLRLVADYLGMNDIKWDSESKSVTLIRQATGENSERKVKVSLGAKRAKLHYGRMWISVTACEDLGLAFATDKTQQIAYFRRQSEKKVAVNAPN